jgi:hypothetical protein
MNGGRELLCRRFAMHAGSSPRRSPAQCESGSCLAWSDGHATDAMETIAEDAESEYELGNCVAVCVVWAAGPSMAPCIVWVTGHDTAQCVLWVTGHDMAPCGVLFTSPL